MTRSVIRFLLTMMIATTNITTALQIRHLHRSSNVAFDLLVCEVPSMLVR